MRGTRGVAASVLVLALAATACGSSGKKTSNNPTANDSSSPSTSTAASSPSTGGGSPAAAGAKPSKPVTLNILDIAGNVWEWTDTCYTRTVLDSFGNAVGSGTKNCGVRVVEGRHRAYVVDFVRDARAGGCAAGVPPSNLGFRLVRESKGTWSIF